jgi:hypothetical protein
LTSSPVLAGAVNLSVPAIADPWLAGMPDGSTASLEDVAPQQSPTQVTGVCFTAGATLSFSASGICKWGPDGPDAPPDGLVAFIGSHVPGDENGMSNIVGPSMALVGVFLDASQPSFSTPPATLDFSTAASRDFLVLSPQLRQVFFIGDGLTSTNAVQSFEVPAGATRLFLGPLDGFGWHNNVGSFEVQVLDSCLPTDARRTTWAGVKGFYR